MRMLSLTMLASSRMIRFIAKQIISAFDFYGFSIYHGIGDFFSGVIVNPLNGGSCHVHSIRATLLHFAFQINQSYGFIFVHRHYDDFSIFAVCIQCPKYIILRKATHASPFSWSRHLYSSSIAIQYHYITFYGFQMILVCFL